MTHEEAQIQALRERAEIAEAKLAQIAAILRRARQVGDKNSVARHALEKIVGI